MRTSTERDDKISNSFAGKCKCKAAHGGLPESPTAFLAVIGRAFERNGIKLLKSQAGGSSVDAGDADHSLRGSSLSAY